MGWPNYALAFAAFFVTHTVPVRPAVKARIIRLTGQRVFTAGYSALSLVMLAVLISAAGQAPYVSLWHPAVWHKYVVLTGMFGVCMLLALSLGRPNPFSFGGAQNHKLDPDRPGVVGWVRHPILIALGLWAGLHILPNGDLAYVILFGVFLGFALLGQRIIDRRKQRQMGETEWQALVSRARHALPWHTTCSGFEICLRLFAGGIIWAVLIIGHSSVIGVSPLP